MKTKELRDKETNVLQEELATKRRHLFDLRTQAVTEKLEDPSQVGKTRREIAQVMTLLRQRELAEKKQKATAAAAAK
jgi:large subunit ribosomal protein L29